MDKKITAGTALAAGLLISGCGINAAPYADTRDSISYEQENAGASAVFEYNTVYLTFDDGPSYLTGKILDVLEEYDVKATFFVTYQPDYEEMYAEIAQRGHVIGVHSASHEYSEIYSSYECWLSDFMKIYSYIYEQTGVYASLYRFPGGSMGNPCRNHPETVARAKEYLYSRGMEYFDWNVENGDGSYVTAYQAYENVIDNIRDRHLPVILMHDGAKKESTLAALPDILKQLKEWGYTFDVLSLDVPCIHQGESWDY